ncbi:MAG TPA: glycosyltransferase [Polyangiaceae bacterium]|nr:glycosyltransferase [Polyangiaceae bacterium]
MSTIWILAMLPVLPLAITLLNLATWKRPRPCESEGRRVSVLIPARNEAPRIARVLESVLASRDVLEVLVYDDQSSDATATLVGRFAQADERVKLLSGRALPDGWIGKPHACQRLFEAARGELLVFVDADVTLEKGAFGALVALLDQGAGVVTAVPRQVAESFAERLIMPLLVLTYTSWLPLRLVDLSRNSSFLAANGQLLALRRRDCASLGGFERVRGEIVDDVAYCRLAKRRGLRVAFVDGCRLASCRMYRSWDEIWRGFSKNIFAGVGSSRILLTFVLLLHLGAWVWPYVGMLLSLAHPQLLLPSVTGVGACLAVRAALVWRFEQPVEGMLLHPVAVALLCALALNSYLWHERGRIEWAGRAYDPRGVRA